MTQTFAFSARQITSCQYCTGVLYRISQELDGGKASEMLLKVLFLLSLTWQIYFGANLRHKEINLCAICTNMTVWYQGHKGISSDLCA